MIVHVCQTCVHCTSFRTEPVWSIKEGLTLIGCSKRAESKIKFSILNWPCEDFVLNTVGVEKHQVSILLEGGDNNVRSNAKT